MKYAIFPAKAFHWLLLTFVFVVTLAACIAAPNAPAGAPQATPVATFTATTIAAGSQLTEPTVSTNATVLLPTVTPTPAPALGPNQVQVALHTVVDGLDRPVYVTHAGDGTNRLFIVEKGGTIRIFAGGQLLPTPLLDITDRVNSSGNEQGLLGLAFAPTGDFIVVNYTDIDGNTHVARFRIVLDDPNRADPASESTILTLEQPARNHNGGMVLFGPDGYLWIGTGDGGASYDRFGNGQNPQTLLGKMLRLDVTSDPSQPYTIPADNPWVTAMWNGADVRDEIWALGLRNPWRFSFDRQNHDLWIGDVGQNQYEEIDFVPANCSGGLNFGWPIMEGLHCVTGDACDAGNFVLPIHEYDHSGHCSVTGGYVYRGRRFPALDGVYFFGDYCSGVIWASWPTGSGQRNATQVLASGLMISSFGEDETGELYLTDYSGGAVMQLIVAP